MTKCITKALKYRTNLVKVTDEHIQSSHLAIYEESKNFHWKDYQDEVDAEVEWVKQQ